MFDYSKLYSNASNARRAARANGAAFTRVEPRDGKWAIVAPMIEKVTIRHKDFAVYGSSRIEKPCAFVRDYLNGNPGVTRKDAVEHLVRAGVSYCTAKTQYQVWFRNQKGA